MAKIYRVNVRTKTVSQEELPEKYRLLGGRSLISQVLTDEVNPACDSLDPGNKLIICTSTSPMGADHTAGLTLEAPLDPLANIGQTAVSSMMQPISAAADSFMCLFAWFSAASPETIPELMAGIYGGEWDFDKVLDIGRQSALREKAFNTAAGLQAADDRLPEFFTTEKSPATGATFDVNPLEMDGVLNY